LLAAEDWGRAPWEITPPDTPWMRLVWLERWSLLRAGRAERAERDAEDLRAKARHEKGW